ncbi:MAG: M24 family metallopeptidase [bacterium]|nr:M24 family metallopeptidase [bacterium]
MRYVVRMDIPDPFFLLDSNGRQYIFLDRREYGVFQEKSAEAGPRAMLLEPLIDEARRIYGAIPLPHALALHILSCYGVAGERIAVPTNFPLDIADFLRAKGVTLEVCSSIYPERLVKTSEEVAFIREALRRTDAAFLLIEKLLGGATIKGDELWYGTTLLTSEYVKQRVDETLLRYDMIATEGMIVACGAQAAMPHHPGSGPIRPCQTIVCDIFPRNRTSGYFADVTRTYVKGEPPEKVRRMYAAVREAQRSVLERLRPGLREGEAHQSAVEAFTERGFVTVGDAGFIHGTGHGLGLDVHEEPFLRASRDGLLEEGNIVTVEPGLYEPGLGGVRIEDVVVITPSGCGLLTAEPREYIIP